MDAFVMGLVAPSTVSNLTSSRKSVSWFLIQKVPISTQLSMTQGNLNLSLFYFYTEFVFSGVLTFFFDFIDLTPFTPKLDTLDLEDSSDAFSSILDMDDHEGLVTGGSPQSVALMMSRGNLSPLRSRSSPYRADDCSPSIINRSLFF